MAILDLSVGYFELALLKRQFPEAQGVDRTWIHCRIVLNMSAGAESMTIRNLQNVFVQDTDLPYFFRGVERFLNDCKQERPILELVPEFVFVTYEGGFELTFEDGSVDEDLQEGEITIC